MRGGGSGMMGGSGMSRGGGMGGGGGGGGFPNQGMYDDQGTSTQVTIPKDVSINCFISICLDSQNGFKYQI